MVDGWIGEWVAVLCFVGWEVEGRDREGGNVTDSLCLVDTVKDKSLIRRSAVRIC